MISSIALTLVAVCATYVFVYSWRRTWPVEMCTCTTKMIGKTVIITGGNAGIGKETSRELARHGAKVILACRNKERAMKAVEDIRETTGNNNVEFRKLDLCSFSSVKAFANHVLETETRLDVLINNAGISGSAKLTVTEDGCEEVMQSNHLGHFLLTLLLLDLIKKTAPSRIVVVASLAHITSFLCLNDLHSSKWYINWFAYSNSKLCNILFTFELAKRLKGTGVTVNSLHPGLVSTELFENRHDILSYSSKLICHLFGRSAVQGAQTTLHLALCPNLENVSGKYFQNCHRARILRGKNEKNAKKLWEISEQIVKMYI